MIPLHEELLGEFQNFAKTAPTAQSVMERIAQRLHEEVARLRPTPAFLSTGDSAVPRPAAGRS